MFHVLLLDSRIRPHENILFEGNASSVILPGKEGEFEILDFHKPILSRLKKGVILVDNTKEFLIQDGIAKVDHQNLIAFIQLEGQK